jgi:hypothetical protein
MFSQTNASLVQTTLTSTWLADIASDATIAARSPNRDLPGALVDQGKIATPRTTDTIIWPTLKTA